MDWHAAVCLLCFSAIGLHPIMKFKLFYDIILRILRSPVIWIAAVFFNRQTVFGYINSIYQNYLDLFHPSIEVFAGTLPYIYVGVVAVLATVLSILVSSEVSRQNQRRQNTVRILLESRVSQNYSTLTKIGRNYFSSIDDGTVKTYRRYKAHLKSSGSKRNGAEAVMQMLNYFEFLSAGILYNNFDETMMEKSVRGILCLRVYQMRFIIQEVRKQRPKSYEHLVAVYWRWFDEETDKPLPKRVNLGSSPPVLLMKLHKLVLKLPPFI